MEETSKTQIEHNKKPFLSAQQEDYSLITVTFLDLYCKIMSLFHIMYRKRKE